MSAPDATAADPASVLQQAMHCHSTGLLDAAETLYEQILSRDARHADALHLLGVLEAQRRRHARAAELIARAIDARPLEPMFHNNLGNVCIETREFAAAEIHYRRALALDAQRPDALNNLGILLSLSQRADEAEGLLRRAIELAPDFGDARHSLANHFLRHGQLKEAMEVCVEGRVVAPRSTVLRRVLGVVYTSLGMNEEAAALYRAWLQIEPDSAEARFRLIACTGVGVPSRAPDRYVAETFDSFASSFDAKLEQLSYKAPELVAAAVARHAGPPARQLDVIDAGCGTGWCGPLLKPHARHLAGVDLSAGMLSKARDRGVYDALVQEELVAYLRACAYAACDLLVCADTLCYFGALEEFADAARQVLRERGLLVFTVEAHPDEDAGASLADFRLQGHGRYSHRRRYVESALSNAALAPVELQPVILRTEAGRPVEGWLVCARAGLAT